MPFSRPEPGAPRTLDGPRGIVGVLAFCGVVASLMQTLVIPLLPDFPELLGTTRSDASWLVTATLLAGAVCTPLFGRLGDMYGKRRIMLVSLAMLTLGSVLGALSTSLAPMLVARALQGSATAVVPLGISIMRDELPKEKIGSAVALMSSTLGIGSAIGLPLAGLVAEHASWHVLFWFAAAVGLLDIVLLLLVVPESPLRSRGRFDAVGAAGLSAILVSLLLAISKGADWGWSSPLTTGLFAASAVLLVAWVAYELRVPSPLVDIRTSRLRPVLLTNLASLLIGFAMFASNITTTQMVQAPSGTGYGFDASLAVAGLCMLPGGLAMGLLSPVSAWLSRRSGPRVTLAVGAGVIALGYASRAVLTGSLWQIVVGVFLVSCGTGIAYAAMPSLIMASVPITQTAAANGLNGLVRSIGSALSSATVAAMLASHLVKHDGVTYPSLSAFVLIFVGAALAGVAALVLALCVPRARRAVAPVPDSQVDGAPVDGAPVSGAMAAGAPTGAALEVTGRPA